MLPEGRWLLDTCVVSELARERPEPAVVNWLQQHGPHCRMPAVSLGEFAFGVESLAPSARRNRLQAWVGEIEQMFSSRLLDTDRRVWTTFGRLKASVRRMGRPQDDLDLLIAATALVYGLALATRNLRHFQDTGVRLINPWSPLNE